MRLYSVLSALFLFLMPVTVYGVCSAEDVQKKAAEFATISQNMAQKDPHKFASVMQELQPELRSLQGSSDNDKLCRFYDKAIVKMK